LNSGKSFERIGCGGGEIIADAVKNGERQGAALFPGGVHSAELNNWSAATEAKIFVLQRSSNSFLCVRAVYTHNAGGTNYFAPPTNKWKKELTSFERRFFAFLIENSIKETQMIFKSNLSSRVTC
jgi:hypothetical protein